MLQKCQSKLSLEEYCSQQKLYLSVADANKPYPGIKFDRIICNLLLMMVDDPEGVIRSLSEVAEEGCLMGVSVWGD